NEQRLREAFAALSKEALQSNSTELLKLAEVKFEDQRKVSQEELEKRKVAVEQLVKPIAESLGKTGQKLGELDQKWVAEQSRLGEQLRQMTEAEKSLRDETSKLAKALSKPEIRGRYGEIQLRRVVELAGMTSYCDFDEQRSVRDSD